MERMTGVIRFYNEKRGFGFIAADNGADYFYHISNVAADGKPQENQLCEFDVQPTAKGISAVNIQLM
jgi:CspA family cold shock protein